MLSFITGNANKLAEVRAILGADVAQLDIDLPEIQELDAHAVIKAKLDAAFEHHDGPFIVEDTSLSFDGMNGLPGTLIKWFLKTIGPEGLAQLGTSFGAAARAKTLIGFARHADDIQYFEGEVAGKIVQPRGTSCFGWDGVFEPEGYDKTFAEMTSEEKNAMSMRRMALEKLKAAL